MSENSLWEGIQAGNYCKSSILLYWDFCNFKQLDELGEGNAVGIRRKGKEGNEN